MGETPGLSSSSEPGEKWSDSRDTEHEVDKS